MRYEISEILKRDSVMNLVFGNCSVPKDILGRHYVKEGQVIAAFHPTATSMVLIDDKGKRFPMDRMERQPVFALFFDSRRAFSYEIEMKFEDGNSFVTADPYCFESQITKLDEKLFMEGSWKDSYKKLGAHPMEIDGVAGTYFAVWAPNAKRVSVVGDFNFWDGLMYPMNRLSHTGIFELFIPGVKVGAMYKYEVKDMKGAVCLKTDPHGFGEEKKGNASYVLDLTTFAWDDEEWMADRHSIDYNKNPLAICDISLGYKHVCELREGFLKEGYTHLLLSENAGRDASKIFGCKRRFGVYTPVYCERSANHMRSIVNSAHENKIGVLMEISLEYFQCGTSGLEFFDGTSVYGYQDERVGLDQKQMLRRFNCSKNQVANYLISAMRFYMDVYHIDGFIYTHTAAKENLDDAIAFTRKAVKEIRDYDPSVLIIENVREENKVSQVKDLYKQMGFDFYWNYHVKSSVDQYFEHKVDHRRQYHYQLSLPAYRSLVEDSVLLLNHKGELGRHNEILKDRAEGQYDLVSKRTMEAGYFLGMPGKKSWVYAGNEEPAVFKTYRLHLLKLYEKYKALYTSDPVKGPLEWINPVDVETGVVTYLRRAPEGHTHLLFVSNFSDKHQEGYRVGVPEAANYRLITNSDWKEFGGFTDKTDQILKADQICHDLRPYSIKVDLTPYTTKIYEFVTDK